MTAPAAAAVLVEQVALAEQVEQTAKEAAFSTLKPIIL
jgi:hypothetical protein